MGNSKSVKKGVAVVTAVIVAVVMVCVSIVRNLLSTKTESSNQTYLDDAKAQLTEYSDNYNYTKFEFMNSLFEKANVIASVVTENTSAETNAALVKNLGINSFVMTDADGKIITSSDDKKVGTNFLDDETTKQFKANLKGMKVKSISEPTAVEGEDGVYTSWLALQEQRAASLLLIQIQATIRLLSVLILQKAARVIQSSLRTAKL